MDFYSIVWNLLQEYLFSGASVTSELSALTSLSRATFTLAKGADVIVLSDTQSIHRQ